MTNYSLHAPPLWEKIFVAIGFLILAESFELIIPSYQAIRMVYFVGIVGVTVLYHREIANGLLRSPILVALCGLACISFLWSQNMTGTISRSIALIMSLLFAAYLATRYTLRDQLQILLITGIIFVVSSLLFIFALPEYGQQGTLWRGVFAQKNGFGRAMLMVALVILTYSTDRPLYTVLRFIGYGSVIFMIFMSDSMTSVIVVLSVSALSLPLRAFWLGRVPGIALMSAAFIPILIMLYLAITVDTDEILIALGRNPTLTGRTDIWERLEFAMSQRPILGYGYNGFWRNWGGMYGELWSFYDNFQPASAHNTYYNTIIEVGFVGLAIFILSTFFIILRAIFKVMKEHTPEALWPILYISAMLITGFSEDFILFTSIGWTLFMMVAIGLNAGEVTYSARQSVSHSIQENYATKQVPAFSISNQQLNRN